jgi:hypothetical protein
VHGRAVLQTRSGRIVCEGYNGLAPGRYCKEDLNRVQKAIRVEGTIVRCFNNNGTPSVYSTGKKD